MAKKENWHFNKKEQHRLKRDILLKVAAECFNQKGISGTSLKDVAKKLGITDAALYYYVKNKEEVVTLCYARALDLGEHALDKAMDEGKDSLEKLQYYIRYQIEKVCDEEGPVAILSEIPSLEPEHQKQILSDSKKHTKRITQLLIDGIEEGSIAIHNPVITCDAILGALNWMPKWCKKENPFEKGYSAASDRAYAQFDWPMAKRNFLASMLPLLGSKLTEISFFKDTPPEGVQYFGSWNGSEELDFFVTRFVVGGYFLFVVFLDLRGNGADLDARGFQAPLADLEQLRAGLVVLQKLVQRNPLALHALHDLLQPRNRLLESEVL